MPQTFDTTELLLLVLRAVVFDRPIPDGFRISEEAWADVLALANKHDLAHLVEAAAKKYHLTGKSSGEKTRIAWYRYVQRDRAISQLRETLEETGVPFIFLKGAVVQHLYPEPWMRTSSDIDVLIHETDADAAIDALIEKAGFRRGVTAPHVFQLLAPGDCSIELHHFLVQPQYYPRAAATLNDIWSVAFPCRAQGAEYALPEEYVYLYHIAHMMKHFCGGGCGVRSIMDLELLLQQKEHNAAKCSALLQACGMDTFTAYVERLAKAWFEDGPIDGIEALSHYILSGGVYGTKSQSIAAKKGKDGTMGYYLRRLFPPEYSMQNKYPILKKARILLPLCWGMRILCLCNRTTRMRIRKECRISVAVQKDSIEDISALMEQMGIEDARSI